MSNKSIQLLMDCHTTKRWTLCATAIESTVASHSFNVTAIALDIFNRLEDKHGFTEGDIAVHAIFHDADEAETGDIPTPTKMAIKSAGVDPHKLTPSQGLFPPIPDFVKKIIKLADLMENYMFIKGYGVGPRARNAEQEVFGRLQATMMSMQGPLLKASSSCLRDLEDAWK